MKQNKTIAVYGEPTTSHPPLGRKFYSVYIDGLLATCSSQLAVFAFPIPDSFYSPVFCKHFGFVRSLYQRKLEPSLTFWNWELER